jgi:cysteine desulfurase
VHRLPHLLTFSCLYVDGEALLGALDRAGFAVSSGSSCSSSTLTPSHVLAAMGVLTEGNVRVSLPPDCTEADIDLFLDVLPKAVADVRAQLDPPPTGPAPDADRSDPDRPHPDALVTDTPGPDRLLTDTPGPAAPTPDTLVLDTLGRRCPIPVIELARHFAEVPVGGLVAVLSDDEAARFDIPAWCEMRAQEYAGEAPAAGYLPTAGDPAAIAYMVRRLS